MISYAEAKAYLQLNDDSDQTLVETLIDYVEAEIQATVDQTIDTVTVTNEVLKYKRHRGLYDFERDLNLHNQELYLFTKKAPISSVTLNYKGSAISTDNYRIEDDLYIVMYRAYDDHQGNLTASYTAGYTTTPDDIKSIALQGVKAMYKDASTAIKGSSSIKSKSIKSYRVTYADVTRLYSGTVKQYLAGNMHILNKYMLASV